MSYQIPKTGARCGCRPGLHRDNCPNCEGTGWAIDFAAHRREVDDSRRAKYRQLQAAGVATCPENDGKSLELWEEARR